MALLAIRLIVVFVVGACLGSLVNWAIYTLAWRPRPISPWSRLPAASAAALVGSRADLWLVRAEPRSGGSRRAVLVRPLLLELASAWRWRRCIGGKSSGWD